MVAQIDRDLLRTRPRKALQRLIAHTLLQGRPLTTGARWLNPVIFTQYALTQRAPALRRVNRPVLILGAGRSGTTILGKVLGVHRDLVFLNEPKALWQSVYPFDDVIGSYSDADARYALNETDTDEARSVRMRRLYSYALTVTAGRRVCDKYPEMIFRVPFVRAVFPDACLLFLIRDGRDTLTSITKWSQDSGVNAAGHRDDWWGRDDRKWKLLVRDVVAQDEALRDRADQILSIDRHEDRAAVEWVVTMRKGLALPAEAGLHLVSYEDLCRQPEAVLGRVAEHCGLRQDPRWLRYAARTFKPVEPRPPVELNPLVADVFDETMRRLGYA